MLHLTRKYRKQYTGEDIIVDRRQENQMWHSTKETVPNAVTNNQISGRAVVIGNGPSRLGFDLKHLKKYSGLLGATTVQTYGCNALHRDFSPDFLIATGNNKIIHEVANSQYIHDNVVYTNSIHLLEYPGKFYLIPYDPYADAGTTAAYIAAFDGHEKIYLLGFDGHDTSDYNSNIYAATNAYDDVVNFEIEDQKWIDNRAQLFNVYRDVDFVWVTQCGRNSVPEKLKWVSNFRQINFKEFVLETDL